MFDNLMARLLELAATPAGPLVLIAFAYLEGFVLPIPHDALLVAVALANPKLSFVYAAMTTLAGVLGLATDYGIGRVSRKTTLIKWLGGKRMSEIQELTRRYQNWTTLVVCLTPVSDKIYALMAGFMKLDFKAFVLIAGLARAARVFTTAALVYFYGEAVRGWMEHSFKWFAIGLLAVIAALYFFSRLIYSFLVKKLHLPDGAKKK